MLRHTELIGRAIVASYAGDGTGHDGGDTNNPSGGGRKWLELVPVLVFLADFIIFFPLWLITSYTFTHVFPVLTMVEDENPPPYEPVSLDDPENISLPEEPSVAPRNKTSDSGGDKPIGASFRGLNRLLRSNCGFRSYLKGLGCLAFLNMVNVMLYNTFASALHPFAAPLGTLIASLALVQVSTAWVHIVITPHSGWFFWRRLPSFKRAFDATWKPTVLSWLATEVASLIMWLTGLSLGMNIFDLYKGQGLIVDGIEWKGPVLFIVALIITMVITVPAYVILVRVQASLLPVDRNTIIPFDRTFGGKVEPAVVSGLGYATISDAWSTFSAGAWRRLYTLYAKILLVNVAIASAFAGIIYAEFFLLSLLA